MFEIMKYKLSVPLVSIIVPVLSCHAAPTKIYRDDLGRSVKLTILVDKVMQPQAGWVTEEWMVEEARKELELAYRIA